MPYEVILTHSGAQLDAAITKVETDYADVSGVTATAADVLTGKKFVGADKVLTDGTCDYADVSGVTATAGDVLTGKKFVNSSGVLTDGTCDYADVSGVTAVAGDVASGKYFVDSSGVLTEGTASGGGTTLTKAGVSMFLIESATNGSYTIHVTYQTDASVGNSYCVDEDGNVYDGSNGKFQYALWNGGSIGTWYDLAEGQTSRPGAIIVLRFLNTNTNKPFICSSYHTEFTGNDAATELWISNVSGQFRYGPAEVKPVPDANYGGNVFQMYSASIGLAYQFDWIIVQELD